MLVQGVWVVKSELLYPDDAKNQVLVVVCACKLVLHIITSPPIPPWHAHTHTHTHAHTHTQAQVEALRRCRNHVLSCFRQTKRVNAATTLRKEMVREIRDAELETMLFQVCPNPAP